MTHIDNRGFFRELIHQKNCTTKNYIHSSFKIKKNVLRGLHFQSINPQGKFLSVIKGKIFDVAVDLRKNSKNYI